MSAKKQNSSSAYAPRVQPPGFGVRQPSGALDSRAASAKIERMTHPTESARGLAHSKTLARVGRCAWLFLWSHTASEGQETRTYENRLTPIAHPKPLLGDYPQFVEPVREIARFEAPAIVDESEADLHVRAWRFSYNARGIIEMPNHLRAANTAVIMVHPWGTDDGQGWNTPEPAGAADFCTPEKNHLAGKHTRKVISPFLKALRGKVAFVMYSLPGGEDPIRKKLYRSFRGRPTDAERREGASEMKAKLASFTYRGGPLPSALTLSSDKPVVNYFQQFPGLDATDKYDPKGF